jgi:hypothetical protein
LIVSPTFRFLLHSSVLSRVHLVKMSSEVIHKEPTPVETSVEKAESSNYDGDVEYTEKETRALLRKIDIRE